MFTTDRERAFAIYSRWEPARGAVAKGFAEGLPEVWAMVRPDNEPSMAVRRRLGSESLRALMR